MKKFLFLLLISSFSFGQIKSEYKTIVFPGCEKYEAKQDLINCFHQTTKLLIEGYFKSNQNLFEYLQTPNFKEKAAFQINTKGEYVYKPSETNSEMFSFIVSDLFRVLNLFLKNKNLAIKPAETIDGKVAALNFNMPIAYEAYSKIAIKEENPIRFTLNSNQKFMIRQSKDFKFMVYNEKGELIETLNSLIDLVSNPLILDDNSSNLIVEETINNKQVRIVIDNLFRNVYSNFLLKVYENDVMIKEYKEMDDFSKSEYAKYVL